MFDLVDQFRFYGRRLGRVIHPAHQRLMDRDLPRFGISSDAYINEQTIDPSDFFEHDYDDYVLEIGFGSGEHLIGQALAHPNRGFIGAEPFLNGVSRLVRYIDEHQLKNIRILTQDVRPFLFRLSSASLSRCFLLFPDPWPKRRHWSRRFICRVNLDQISRCLKPKGQFRVASDHSDYVMWSLHHLLSHGDFSWPVKGKKDWIQKPKDWINTRYEMKALKENRSCSYLTFVRK